MLSKKTSNYCKNLLPNKISLWSDYLLLHQATALSQHFVRFSIFCFSSPIWAAFFIMFIVNFENDFELFNSIRIASPVLINEEQFEKFKSPNPLWVKTAFEDGFRSVIRLLDSGADVVVIPFGYFQSMRMNEISAGLSRIPLGRLAVEFEPDLNSPSVGPNFDSLTPLVENFIIKNAPLEVVMNLRLNYGDNTFIVSDGSNALSHMEKGFSVMISSCDLSLGVGNSRKISFVRLLMYNAKSDRSDGLFTTVVVDNHGIALGVCYSSYDSIEKALETKTGVYMSRKRGIWYKGQSSGATQELHSIKLDCDSDTLCFVVTQKDPGFCHLNTKTCFGNDKGLTALASLLENRRKYAPEKSYTKRLFDDANLLRSKILEEAEELCSAETREEICWEAADLIYFALVKCIGAGVSLADIENNLDRKSKKITRRPGDAKPAKIDQQLIINPLAETAVHAEEKPFTMKLYRFSELNDDIQRKLLQRPIIKTKEIMDRVTPIVDRVKNDGDSAVIDFTKKFDGVELESLVLKAPFPEESMKIESDVKNAIDLAYSNIEKFHAAQLDKPLVVETMPGVVCSRFSRPIEKVGLYVPGGTAVLPSSTLMLGVPAMVAGCSEIVIATPPRKDGNIAPEVVYVAEKVGASLIVKAGGAQAVAAMAYGTESVPKVDKICGPGNQYVTAAKMIAQSDSSALLSIDMPAGPSELLVIADGIADPRYVVSDLLSQAEHGEDSQVVLLTVGMDDSRIEEYQAELYKQASVLPRSGIIKVSLSKSYILAMHSLDEAISFSNKYAPEHLILNILNPQSVLKSILNAGSVFVGPYSPER
jgi:phosphoribosyl-ATP pyrophosphohydrolase/phosphoribosyl-AMP cyclohydrolase/histidinol dehydrogenase